MENTSKVWLVGLAVIVSIVFGMWVFSPTEVVVSGIGKVSVPATAATFNVTVSVSGDTAATALVALKASTDNLKSKLSVLNIIADNVTETPITVTPAAAVVANAKGFQALTTLTVKMNNITAVPEVVAAMYESGATLVSQPVVSVEDQSKLEKEALEEALSQARKNLNDTVGLRPIKKIIGIEQASSGNVATVTKATPDNVSEFEVSRAVAVTYRVW
jgi:uncharacterized protein YggE